MHVAFDAARHHLLLAVVALGVGQQRGDQQRLLHHRSVHGCLLFGRGRWSGQASAGVAGGRGGVGGSAARCLVGFVAARGEQEGAARRAAPKAGITVSAGVRPQASDSTPAMNGPGGQAEQVLEQRQHRRAGGAHAGVDDVDHDRRHRADGAGGEEAAEQRSARTGLSAPSAMPSRVGAEGEAEQQPSRRGTAAPSRRACGAGCALPARSTTAPQTTLPSAPAQHHQRRLAPRPAPARCRARG